MFTDYRNRNQRLNKDFDLADNDDFFGFSDLKQNTTLKDVLITIAGLAVLWGVLVLWFSF